MSGVLRLWIAVLVATLVQTAGGIELPRQPKHITRFLDEVDKHSDTIEYQIRIAGLLSEVKARDGLSVTQWSSLRHGSLQHLGAIRRKLHEDIVSSIVTPTAKPPAGTKPMGMIILGPPGAGKTSLGVPLVKTRSAQDFVSVNPDDVKERLPEYEGWNASALHEESSHVAEMLIKKQATNSKLNLIYDITGRKKDKVKQAIDELVEYGFDVYLMLVDLPPCQAAGRAWGRFQEDPFGRVSGKLQGSRYVAPYYVYHEVGAKPRQTFQALKTYPKICGFCKIESMTSEPGSPKIVEKGGKW